MEKIKNHNNAIETKYLDHELKKFKKEISITRTKLSAVHHNLEDNDLLMYKTLDNTKLISSFSHGHECVQEFYRDSRDASLMENRIFENCAESFDERELSNMSDNEDVSKDLEFNDNYMKTHCEVVNDRCVRFGGVIEIHDYEEDEIASPICSYRQLDTSRDDITTEPVLEVKLVPKEQILANTTLELIGKPIQCNSVDMPILKSEEKIKKNRENSQKSCQDIADSNENPFVITKINVLNQPQSMAKQPTVENQIQIPPEQSAIISDLFTKDSRSDAMRQDALQKYFLRWIHFTTIEKISKENISCNQSRIQKIEAFLNNIRLEKKKHLRADPPVVDIKKKNCDPQNPLVLARKYQNK